MKKKKILSGRRLKKAISFKQPSRVKKKKTRGNKNGGRVFTYFLANYYDPFRNSTGKPRDPTPLCPPNLVSVPKKRVSLRTAQT